MPAEMHHVHMAMSQVAEVVSLRGNIHDLNNVEITWGSTTEAQREAAKDVLRNFDITKNYDPDPEAFLDDVAADVSFSMAQYVTIARLLRIADGAKRKDVASYLLPMDDARHQQLKALCEKHCIKLL